MIRDGVLHSDNSCSDYTAPGRGQPKVYTHRRQGKETKRRKTKQNIISFLFFFAILGFLGGFRSGKEIKNEKGIILLTKASPIILASMLQSSSCDHFISFLFLKRERRRGRT